MSHVVYCEKLKEDQYETHKAEEGENKSEDYVPDLLVTIAV